MCIRDSLKAAGIRVKADVTDKSPGFKFAEQEMRGIPVRIECGPKDIESGQAVICRRDTREKYIVKFEELAAKVQEVLDTMQKEMLERARAHRDAHTYVCLLYTSYRHYAPKADLAIVEGPTEEVINAINQFVKEDQANGLQAGIIATEETISRYPCGTVKCIGSREAEETIAHNLYEVLREFDQCQVSKIYSERCV